jgi:CHAT domain-containing protein
MTHLDRIPAALILGSRLTILIQQNKIKESKQNLIEIQNKVSNYSFDNPIKHIETTLQIASFFEKINDIKESSVYNAKGFKLIYKLPCRDDIAFYSNLLKYYQIEILLLLKENNYLKASKVAQVEYLYIDSIQKINPILKKDRLVNELKTSFIDYFFNTKILNETELLNCIYYPYTKDKFPKTEQNVLFIRYWLTQNQLIIWTKRNKKIEVVIKKLDVPLDKTILSVRNAIKELPLAGEKSKRNYELIYQKLVTKLSNLLVPDIPDGIQNIVLFPEHILTILPFEILVEQKDKHRMLFEKYAISYHTITTNKNKKTNKALKREVLAFSPNFKGDDRGYANLKYNEIEIEKISKHLPTVQIKDKNASVLNFKKEAPKYNIIHIATHSDPNLNADEGGELIFTKNINKEEPSSLYASQISSLKIGSNLVVLSACQSAIGDYTPSQGMNSIAQSFLNGGASSVITSLWQVDDRSTAEFMNSFYYYLSKGYPKNKALQFTKKKMMSQSPYFWAPFILIGDTGNI